MSCVWERLSNLNTHSFTTHNGITRPQWVEHYVYCEPITFEEIDGFSPTFPIFLTIPSVLTAYFVCHQCIWCQGITTHHLDLHWLVIGQLLGALPHNETTTYWCLVVSNYWWIIGDSDLNDWHCNAVCHMAYIFSHLTHLGQVMHICVCKLAWQGPIHYLNQCWNIVNWTLGNKLRWILNRYLYIFI